MHFQISESTFETLFQIAGHPMAISHELSSEIAAALFAAKERSPRELNDLKETVFKIHSALEHLKDEDRVARLARVDAQASQSADLSDLKTRSAGQDS